MATSRWRSEVLVHGSHGREASGEGRECVAIVDVEVFVVQFEGGFLNWRGGIQWLFVDVEGG
jgi:hypothetical protein